MLCGRVAASAAEVHLVVPLLLGHVRVFEPQLATLIALGELCQHTCMYLRMDGADARGTITSFKLGARARVPIRFRFATEVRATMRATSQI